MKHTLFKSTVNAGMSDKNELYHRRVGPSGHALAESDCESNKTKVGREHWPTSGWCSLATSTLVFSKLSQILQEHVHLVQLCDGKTHSYLTLLWVYKTSWVRNCASLHETMQVSMKLRKTVWTCVSLRTTVQVCTKLWGHLMSARSSSIGEVIFHWWVCLPSARWHSCESAWDCMSLHETARLSSIGEVIFHQWGHLLLAGSSSVSGDIFCRRGHIPSVNL
jgi:hypothetical protein